MKKIKEKIAGSKNMFIFVVLAVSFIKGLMWIAMVPLFEAPDEPVQFDYVLKIAENKKIFFDRNDKKDSFQSEEICTAARYSGLLKFSPSYRNKYNFTPDQTGENEKNIDSLPFSLRKENSDIPAISIQYPPFYYLLATVPYGIFYNSSIITRVFAVRLFSLLLALLTIFAVYKTAELVFAKQKYLPAIIALLVSFNPMFTFISSSVNSDNLLTLFFTVFLYFYAKIFLNKHKPRDIVFLVLIVVLGNITKQHFALSLVMLFGLFCFTDKYSLKTRIIAGAACLALLFLAMFNLKSNFPVPVFAEKTVSVFRYVYESFLPFFFGNALSASFYGNFGWLNVPVPIWVSRFLLIFTLVCIGLYFYDLARAVLKRKSFLNFRTHLLLLIPVLIYTAGLIYVDCNIKFGLQGRYFFPVISFIYICLISGLLSVTAKKHHMNILAGLSLAAVLFNAYCLLLIILPRYYL